ncbi:MAG: hypothetical protein A2231_05435 [Candidatus Firestonebacteria bacterium RIFOXYA2_FULL_40_8]|nr:MAG: hypothetical protein A2231_05435 [Candidatus Firestonebacteria bacterium RIFOXYA2_FULL_40_8]
MRMKSIVLSLLVGILVFFNMSCGKKENINTEHVPVVLQSSEMGSNKEDYSTLGQYKIRIGMNIEQVTSICRSMKENFTNIKEFDDVYLKKHVIYYGTNGLRCYFDSKTKLLVGATIMETYSRGVVFKDFEFLYDLKRKIKNDKDMDADTKNAISEDIGGVLTDIVFSGKNELKQKNIDKALKMFRLVSSERGIPIICSFDPIEEADCYIAWIKGDKKWVFKERKDLIERIKVLLNKKDFKSLGKLQSPIMARGKYASEVSGWGQMNYEAEGDKDIKVIGEVDGYLKTIGWQGINNNINWSARYFDIRQTPTGEGWEWSGTYEE